MRYTLHVSSLNDYIKSNMFPQRLCIQKGPAMFRDNDAFNAKWKAVLNKCSVDLMLLIMEQSMIIISSNDKKLYDLKLKLQSEVDVDTFPNKLRKIKKVDALEKNMKEFKIRKFCRDTRDYNTNNVYNFSSIPRAKSKKVIWVESTYSDIDSMEGDDSTGTSADEGPSSW